MNKRNFVIVAVAIITAIGWASGWVFAEPSETEKMNQTLQLPKDYYVLGIRNGDLSGDGTTDMVVIYGKKEKEEDIFVEDINVAFIDGATQAVKKSQLKEFTGYEPQIETLVDFTGDQKPEVYIAANTGGSGGYSNYAIIDFAQNVAKNILTPDIAGGLTIKGKYLDGLKAEVMLVETGEKFSIDLKARHKDYIEWKVYDKSGKYIGDQGVEGTANEIFGYPFGSLEAIDIDADGISELMGTQRLIGTNNVERLSHVDSVLQYKNGKWNCIEASYRTYIR
jgi:hypothetical protein